MTPVVVTLPDGSTRSVAAGTPVRDVAADVSPRLAKAALVAKVDDQLVDSSYPLTQDARVQILTADGPEALHVYRHSTAHLLAAAVTKLFPGTQCGIGPALEEPPASTTTSWSRSPFVPEDLEKIEAEMRRLAQADEVFEQQLWPRDEALRFFGDRGEPLKVQLIEEKTAGAIRGLGLHDQGPRHVRRLLPRPARAVDGQAEGLQADDDVERLLEGRREEPADAAGLRHGVLQRQGPAGAPGAARGSARSATTARSARNSGCSCSTRGPRARRSGCTRARCCTTAWPSTCARCSTRPATTR